MGGGEGEEMVGGREGGVGREGGRGRGEGEAEDDPLVIGHPKHAQNARSHPH